MAEFVQIFSRPGGTRRHTVSGATGTDGTWVGTITTEGNVTTVINEAGSVWGGAATLVEEASIGVRGSGIRQTPAAPDVSQPESDLDVERPRRPRSQTGLRGAASGSERAHLGRA